MAKLNRKALIAAAMTSLLAATGAHAQVSDDVVRIGVMADMTGPYAGNGGPGSTVAIRMAVDDFGGKVQRRSRLAIRHQGVCAGQPELCDAQCFEPRGIK